MMHLTVSLRRIAFFVTSSLLFFCNAESIASEINWNKFFDSLAYVESNHNPNAKNKHSSASGMYQLLKGFPVEVNRLAGTKYTSQDRFNPAKAREMILLYYKYTAPTKLGNDWNTDKHVHDLLMAFRFGWGDYRKKTDKPYKAKFMKRYIG